MKHRFIFLIVFLGLAIYLTGCQSGGSFLEIQTRDNGVQKIMVEIARTSEERRAGLMGRKELPEGRGMLFDFHEDPNPVIWMKDMLIPLDLVFIGGDLKVNHVAENVQPCRASSDSECGRYGSENPSPYVLELPAHFTTRHGIGLRDEITLPSGI